MNKGFISPTQDGIRLDLRASPGAKRTPIEGPYYAENAIRLKVAAPPVSGTAEVVLLGIPRSAVVRGASSSDKTLLSAHLQ